MPTLNDYAAQCHKANESWWPKDKLTRSKAQLIALCISELSEALEGHRKDLMDDKLPHRKMVEVELVDFLIRAFDMAGGYGWDIHPLTEYLADLNEYGNVYSRLYVTISDEFAENQLQVISFLIRCYDPKLRSNGMEGYSYLRMAICFTLALMNRMGMDIQGAFDEKMAYNKSRKDHTPEHRAAEGGKKY